MSNDCAQVFFKNFLSQSNISTCENFLKELFEDMVDVYTKDEARTPYTINSARESDGIQRDAIWFAVPEYETSQQDTEYWMPLYRITKSNFNSANPMGETSHILEKVPGGFDGKVHKIDEKFKILQKVLDKINSEFGLDGQYKLNHCVVHRYMGEEDTSRQMHKEPDQFNPHHDKIMDLNLHHLEGIDKQIKQTKPMIFSLSIGADRKFRFSKEVKRKARHDEYDHVNESHLKNFGYTDTTVQVLDEYTMSSGDLICMSEKLNLKYKHSVEKGRGIRYSITARCVHTYYLTDESNKCSLICPYFRFMDKTNCREAQVTSSYSSIEKMSQRYMFSQYLKYKEVTKTPKFLLLDKNGICTKFILENTKKTIIYPVDLDAKSINTMKLMFKDNERVIGPTQENINSFISSTDSMFDIIWLDYENVDDTAFHNFAQAYEKLEKDGILAVTRSTRRLFDIDHQEQINYTASLLGNHMDMTILSKEIYPSKGRGPPMTFVVAQKKSEKKLPEKRLLGCIGGTNVFKI